MADSFWYNDWQYFQQGRKCGKRSCTCGAGGELHGPYWYRRQKAGTREYVGRELDRRLLQTIELRDGLAPALAAHIAKMQADITLLEQVISGTRALQLEDKHRLEELEYAMLIPAVG